MPQKIQTHHQIETQAVKTAMSPNFDLLAKHYLKHLLYTNHLLPSSSSSSSSLNLIVKSKGSYK